MQQSSSTYLLASHASHAGRRWSLHVVCLGCCRWVTPTHHYYQVGIIYVSAVCCPLCVKGAILTLIPRGWYSGRFVALTLSYLLLLGIVIVSTMAMSAFLYHEDETLRDLRVRASGSVTFPAWLVRVAVRIGCELSRTFTRVLSEKAPWLLPK